MSQLPHKAHYDVAIIGGAGHVGLPLAIVFAHKGMKVLIYDINASAIDKIKHGELPFMEHGGEEILRQVLHNKKLSFSTNPASIRDSAVSIITVGTPVDHFMNPEHKAIEDCLESLLKYLHEKQLIILRSTVYPGTTDWLDQYLKDHGKPMNVAFCPERIVQGYAIEELQSLPQIVSGTTPEAEQQAQKLFSVVTPKIVSLKPIEAEFAKLFSNAYRYIQFAIANQFFMMTDSAGIDYHNVLRGIKEDYDRARDIPAPGFAAGPCLFKDTMQLAAFSKNQFSLGNAAMLVNEGLVHYIIDVLQKKYDLKKKTIGLLGMAFKADSDDTRSSLSYKLKKLLSFQAKEVLTTDPYVANDAVLMVLEDVIAKSDIIILCVPHTAYRPLDIKRKVIVDVWNCFGKGFLFES